MLYAKQHSCFISKKDDQCNPRIPSDFLVGTCLVGTLNLLNFVIVSEDFVHTLSVLIYLDRLYGTYKNSGDL